MGGGATRSWLLASGVRGWTSTRATEKTAGQSSHVKLIYGSTAQEDSRATVTSRLFSIHSGTRPWGDVAGVFGQAPWFHHRLGYARWGVSGSPAPPGTHVVIFRTSFMLVSGSELSGQRRRQGAKMMASAPGDMRFTSSSRATLQGH